MALVKFSQDDTQPFGTGLFVNDQGRSIYTTDPDGARSIAPTPAPPGGDDEPAPPGTRVSYAGDASSPYANTVASNEGATGSAAIGAPPGATGAAHAVVAKATQVVPPMGPPPPPASAAPAAPSAATSPAESAASKAASVVPPIVKTSTTVVQGRKAGDVNKQIGTDRAALEGFTGATEANAISNDARAVAGVDKRIESRTAQQTQAKEDAAQYAADQRSADERVKQLMDLPDGQLDPDRFVNSLSTGSKIGLTVLAAISGFANGMRNPNGPTDTSVLNVLTRRIDEDIASQKDSLAQGRLRKSNLIARAEAQGATAKQAEATARAQLWSLAADIGDLQAQRIGLDGAQLAAAKQQTDAMRYQAGVHEGDLRAQTENKIQTSREVETGKPVPAGKGNPELQNKAWEAYTKAIDAGQSPGIAYHDSGLAALGITQPTGTPKRTEGEAKASAVRTAAAPYATKLGLVEDPEHPGQFVAPKGKEDDSPADTIMGGRLFSGSERRKQTREVKETRLQLAHAIMQASGGGMKIDDAEEMVNGHTLGEIAETLNMLNSQYGEHRNEAERNAPAPGVAALGGRPVP